jgi:preprotein translocase subunit SecB
MTQNVQPVFNIEKLYVRDLSLEIPHAPQIFLDRTQPEINVQLHNEASNVGENMYQVDVTVTVTAKVGDKTMFLIEVDQAGIFQISGVPQEDMEPILGIACPNILFPYAREAVSDIATRAGFPPVVLAPVNFEVIYQQRLQAQQAQAQGSYEVPIQ